MIDINYERRNDLNDTVGVLEYVRYQEAIQFLNKHNILKKLTSNRSDFLQKAIKTSGNNTNLENVHLDVALSCLNLAN